MTSALTTDVRRMVNLDSNQFDAFLRVMSLLKDVCNDADIRSGVLRQRSNSHTVIFEFDLTSVVSELNLPISPLKQKIDLFKIFTGNEVSIEESSTEFKVSDSYSNITVINPILSYFDNKFMTDEELIASITDLDNDDLILKCDINKMISERFKTVSQVFNVNAIRVVFEGESCYITAKTQSGDQNAKIINGITLERPVNELVSALPVVPFIMDHDADIQFSMYNVRDNICMSKFTTTIGTVPVNVYTRSQLRDVNEVSTND